MTEIAPAREEKTAEAFTGFLAAVRRAAGATTFTPTAGERSGGSEGGG